MAFAWHCYVSNSTILYFELEGEYLVKLIMVAKAEQGQLISTSSNTFACRRAGTQGSGIKDKEGQEEIVDPPELSGAVFSVLEL